MEITGFRFVELEGSIDVAPGEFYEQRLSRPVDLYEEFRRESATERYVDDPEGDLPISQVFLYVETDGGVTGMAGPITRLWARLAAELEDLLVGRDPLRTEKLWDLMYRREVHGRKGRTMQAISAVDVALWDLKGKYHGEPVYRLLGGPTQRDRPAYASMLGYAVEPEAVRERAAEFRDRGYGAQKWFFRYGVGSGSEGKHHNAELVRAAREATDPEYDLMFDAWMSWDREYARDMFDRIAEYDPRWVEEPVQPDKLDQYAALADAAPFPVAGGEHEYTRWGVHELLDRGCVDVLQSDTYWAGGLTEMRHIATLASVHDVPLIPHGHSVPANAHLIAARPPNVCPLVEYLVKWNERLQHFLADPVQPEDGRVEPPGRPGIGVSIEESAVDRREELSFE